MDKKHEEILEITKDLIKIPSTNSNTKNLYDTVNYVENIFKEYKNAYIYKFDYGEKPAIIIQNFDGKRANITLNGHLDVVPASEEGQFEPILKDNKLYGRGAGDMKSGCAIMIKVMEKILKENFQDKKISLILTTDEEVGGYNGVGKLTEEGRGGDIVIIPDGGSNTKVVNCQKGVFLLNIKGLGQSSHGSRPWIGENAIENIFNLYYELKNHLENQEKIYSNDHWGNTVNINTISGGEAMNIIPEKVEGYIDIRFTEEFNSSKLYEIVKSYIEKYNCELKYYILGERLYTPEDTPEMNKYIHIIKNNIDNNIESYGEHGASDGRFFAGKGSNVIIHRPTTKNIHSHEERVDITHFSNFYNSFLEFIKN